MNPTFSSVHGNPYLQTPANFHGTTVRKERGWWKLAKYTSTKKGINILKKYSVAVSWEETLFCVFDGKLYCLSLNKESKSIPTRWIHAEVEGDEIPNGCLSAGLVFGGKLVIHGGFDSHTNTLTRKFFAMALNSHKRKWVVVSQSGSVPPAMCGHTFNINKRDNTVIAHGGVTAISPQLQLTDSTWVFDLSSQTWTAATPSGMILSLYTNSLKNTNIFNINNRHTTDRT